MPPTFKKKKKKKTYYQCVRYLLRILQYLYCAKFKINPLNAKELDMARKICSKKLGKNYEKYLNTLPREGVIIECPLN